MPAVKPIRGQILGFRSAKRLFRMVIYSPRGYLVPRLDGRILAGATVEDVGFDKSLTASGIDTLRENALEIAPSLVNLAPSEKWVGLRPFAADGLPVLGSFPEIENLFVATAHYRNGILLAPKTAEVLADKIVGNVESEYLRIFSPRRFQTANALTVNIPTTTSAAFTKGQEDARDDCGACICEYSEGNRLTNEVRRSHAHVSCAQFTA